MKSIKNKDFQCINLKVWSWWPIALMLAKRDFKKQFVGTYAGVTWVVLIPILYLLIYTFVFTEIFNPRWVNVESFDGKVQFATFLFCGLTIFSFFSNIFSAGPSFLISMRTTISKIAFHPIALPVSFILNSAFSLIIPIVALTVMAMFVGTDFELGLIFVLLIILPMLSFGLSLLLLVSSTAVFFRDIIQVCKLLSPLLLFLSPIFYPISAVPEEFRYIYALNPLVIPINVLRSVFLGAVMPSAFSVFIYVVCSFFALLFSFLYFTRLSKGFAECL